MDGILVAGSRRKESKGFFGSTKRISSPLSSRALMEYDRLRVLGRIFEPKCEEVTGDWRRLHNEELHNL
jgi:hypothetical protein